MGILFEAFIQTASGVKSQEGTGLGLPISRQFVRLMGGDITVESAVGKGTTFKFDVVVEPISAAEVSQASDSRLVTGLAPGQKTFKILVVEDRWENRALLSRLLEPLGFQLKEAENGEIGVGMVAEWEPDLVLMDMRMPVMDGYEATKRIRALPKGQAVAVVALTASALEHERSAVYSAGCDDFVRKPFRESDLLEKIAKHTGAQYIYEDDTSTAAPAGDGKSNGVTPAMLAELPAEWVAELKDAINLLDKAGIIAAADKIREKNAPAAEAITTMANNYDFDPLLKLLEGN